MKNELQNGILIIDGLPKFCPYQQPVMQMKQPPAQALSISTQPMQPEITYTHQPCGEWCALFKKNVTDGKLRSVGLWCSTLRIEITQEQTTEPATV
jgi:hypothetical protein